jgi:hypothetical protein
MKKQNKKCAELIREKLDERIKEAKRIIKGFDPYDENEEKEKDSIDAFNNWALAWDGCRLELSYGGPQDYFTYARDKNGEIVAIFYSYLNWFDGATIELGHDYFDIMKELAEILFLFE